MCRWHDKARCVFRNEPAPYEVRHLMSFMLQAKPGCYAFLGNGSGAHRATGHGLGPCELHNASYDFNDALLGVGATYWVKLAQAWLRSSACRSNSLMPG
ncbi:Metal-dependent amidase/aminoacylase/carboxypeptidase [Mycetohabitans rhizoxinica HKI 454]|uniref:Metal-dependent amidase/aminoacylase/carboxypeptidase n=1 Tax=Mycetohabitans rhizoxinica (strain DSM 19002 / CIP 109453 / HKI 454) TaxID=882378 RepID=E5APJ4_MYCRK|nr:Metal-dependent amidase/aminoacylase/carboxypeptidase [Mycetohabitans rhizoxinica HKI 454]